MKMESKRGAWSHALLMAAVGGWVMLLQWQTAMDPVLRESATVPVPQVELPSYPAPQADEASPPVDAPAPTF